MDIPVVSVVCLCHNHERFVRQALDSVFLQSHQRVQLVVVDDASTDQSVAVIREHLRIYPDVIFLPLPRNEGICKAFNKGLAIATGSYIIDLSADDILKASRITEGLKAFQDLPPDFGVHFCDAELIDEEGKHLGFHSDRFPHALVPQGNIYKDIIARYFINSPAMMSRRAVFDQLGGYDESLAFEDFDFWIRSSREWKYAYTPKPLVERRIVKGSLGMQQHRKGNPQLLSTLKVCEKIAALNRTPDEREALKKRLRYEFRKMIRLGEWKLALDFFRLWAH